MATDEITLLIQSLQDQIKQQQEVEAEVINMHIFQHNTKLTAVINSFDMS